jgi:hydroxylamine reductase
MSNMFCFQCEQTAGGKGCTKVGVCGKQPEVANKHDALTGALVGLARAAEGKTPDKSADEAIVEGLFATVTNVNFDPQRIDAYTQNVQREKEKLGGAADLTADKLWSGDPDIVSLRSTLLLGLRGMAAYAWHAYVLGKTEPEVTARF